LSQQAMDLNYDGLMIESHCDPNNAWSDKEQQLTPDVLSYILNLLVIRDTKQTTENLTELRNQIDEIDDELLVVLSKRMRISREIGKYKKEHNMPVLQTVRYDEILEKRTSNAVKVGMGANFMKTVLEAIHEESIRQQIEVLNE